MSRTPDYKKKFIDLLHKLSKQYPAFGLGRHISTALSDYGDFWGIPDKELCFAIEKYMAELELDEENIASEDYVNQIVEDGKHLFDTPQEEDDNGDY